MKRINRKSRIPEYNGAREIIVSNRAEITRRATAGHTACAIWQALDCPGSLVNFRRWVRRFKAEAATQPQTVAVPPPTQPRRRPPTTVYDFTQAADFDFDASENAKLTDVDLY